VDERKAEWFKDLGGVSGTMILCGQLEILDIALPVFVPAACAGSL
jgi:hypothetical protein